MSKSDKPLDRLVAANYFFTHPIQSTNQTLRDLTNLIQGKKNRKMMFKNKKD